MIRIFLSLIVLALIEVLPVPSVQASDGHQQWLSQRIVEAKSVKPGMSRAQLLKTFEAEAGLQPRVPTRYVLKSCPMIKIEVTFTGKDEIATVSNVYLEQVIVD